MFDTVKPAFSVPSEKGHLLSWDTFALHRLVFSHKRPVIRGHLPNVDRGQANHKIFCLLCGMRGQLASFEYSLNINFCACNAHFIDLARNLLCGFSTNGTGKTRGNA